MQRYVTPYEVQHDLRDTKRSLDLVDECAEADRSTEYGRALCASATNMCRGLVEGTYYNYGGRGVYDIRREKRPFHHH